MKPSGPGDLPWGVEAMAESHSSGVMGEFNFSNSLDGREGRPEVWRKSFVVSWRLAGVFFSRLYNDS